VPQAGRIASTGAGVDKNETRSSHFAYHRLIPEAFGVFIIHDPVDLLD
jgi:hypothetical protein